MTRGVVANNFEYIKEQYLYHFRDTVSISKEIGATSSAVNEYLRKRGINATLRYNLLFEDIKSANLKLKTDDYNILVDYLKTKYPGLTQKILCYTLEKQNRYKLKRDFDFIDETTIIEKLYKGMTIQNIANELGAKYSWVYQIAQKNDIPAQLIDRCKKLIPKDDLLDLYNELGTAEKISQKLGYSKFVILEVLKSYNVSFGPCKLTKRRLNDPKWCNDAYNRLNSYKLIAEELGDVGQDTVAYYCQKVHGIDRKLIKDVFPILKNSDELKQLYEEYKSISLVSEKIGVSGWVVSQALDELGIKKLNHHISAGEHQLNDFIKSLGFKTIQNDRNIISPKEIDIVIVDKNIGIEYCGVYWHSSKFRNRNDHKDKLMLANHTGIRLITIYETEWLENPELIKNKIRAILGVSDQRRIYARKCVIKAVDNNATELFLKQNHIQGYTKCSLRLGLYYRRELVAVMCFVNKKNHVELVRFATSHQILGGFSKLLNHAKKIINFDIVTFADLRWSDSKNNIYINHGFVEDKILPPAYMYVYRGTLHRREKFMRKNLPNILDHFDANLTEEQNTYNHGIYKIWDCGKIRYRLKNEKQSN